MDGGQQNACFLPDQDDKAWDAAQPLFNLHLSVNGPGHGIGLSGVTSDPDIDSIAQRHCMGYGSVRVMSGIRSNVMLWPRNPFLLSHTSQHGQKSHE